MNYGQMEDIVTSDGYKTLAKSTKLSLDTKLGFNKFMHKISDVLKPYEDTRNSLVEKHTRRDENDNPIRNENGIGVMVDEGYGPAYAKFREKEIDFKVKFDIKKQELKDLCAADLFVLQDVMKIK